MGSSSIDEITWLNNTTPISKSEIQSKITELEIVKSFTPKKGTVVFFQSTPNSYHGVKRFIERNCPKRFFIYGSYALNKPVIWNYKGVSYYPHIISTKKRMLTSFHDANYLTTVPKH